MLEVDSILQGRYRIVRKLGQGGMGAVYEAIDQRFGSTVALKETLVSGDALRKAFEREARLLNTLRHGALPVVIDYFTEGAGVFLVMQYIPGDDLMGMLEENGGPFAPDLALRWTDQLLDVLDYLHSHEPPIVHRDIKPQNLKLTRRGEVILLDFGLAKGSAGVAFGSESGSIAGYTPAYAPFEQIQGAGTDARSDLYSLAATAYHLLTGSAPTDALTRTGAILNSQPDPLRLANELNPKVPLAVSTLLHQAMAINREQRPSSAAEMRQMLHEVTDRPSEKYMDTVASGRGRETVANPRSSAAALAAATTSAPTMLSAPTVKAATTQPVEQKAGSSKKWLIVGALVVLAGIAVGAFLFASSGKTTAPAPAATTTPAPTAPATTATPAASPLKSFAFDVVTLAADGKLANRVSKQAQYLSEDLGGAVSLDMVLIPAATFLMGSPGSEPARFGEEGPQRNVEMRSYYMGKYEVTQAQWRTVASLPKVNRDLNPSPSGFDGVARPVENVSWDEAVEFCARLSKKTGRTYRLPTEAEWEYTCRAGTTTPYHFGDTISPEFANYDGRTSYAGGAKGVFRKETAPVGSLGAANAFGIYDMHGSVWEWCLDPWHKDYNGAPLDGSVWQSGGDTSKRVIRGGAWNREANHCRSAYRLKESPGKKFDVIGFRVVAESK
jgi:formylglycine-generating enzyme required for sulfatase activity